MPKKTLIEDVSKSARGAYRAAQNMRWREEDRKVREKFEKGKKKDKRGRIILKKGEKVPDGYRGTTREGSMEISYPGKRRRYGKD